MKIEEFEDFLAFHTEQVAPETDLVVEVLTADGATVTVPVKDVGISAGQLVIHAMPLPRASLR